jgi:hypothetical protein
MIGERIQAMIADKGYDADAIREELNFNVSRRPSVLRPLLALSV